MLYRGVSFWPLPSDGTDLLLAWARIVHGPINEQESLLREVVDRLESIGPYDISTNDKCCDLYQTNVAVEVPYKDSTGRELYRKKAVKIDFSNNAKLGEGLDLLLQVFREAVGNRHEYAPQKEQQMAALGTMIRARTCDSSPQIR